MIQITTSFEARLRIIYLLEQLRGDEQELKTYLDIEKCLDLTDDEKLSLDLLEDRDAGGNLVTARWSVAKSFEFDKVELETAHAPILLNVLQNNKSFGRSDLKWLQQITKEIKSHL